MKHIHTHKSPLSKENVEIRLLDEYGGNHGNNFRYNILMDRGIMKEVLCQIQFQNGLIPEVGVTGVTVESFIAVCIDRLKKFQEGKCACDQNARAIFYLQQALEELHQRTEDRHTRGVEGTHTP